jgi:hypothetical protein
LIFAGSSMTKNDPGHEPGAESAAAGTCMLEPGGEFEEAHLKRT